FAIYHLIGWGPSKTLKIALKVASKFSDVLPVALFSPVYLQWLNHNLTFNRRTDRFVKLD
ncbi:hypothetical protein, partial [Lactiplantibacillus plantarum]